ncbi:MAG: 23S rRNA (adenine(2503)-C(2))-methyltransferase RlmN [Cyclobacteriaceae bacterium]
MIDIKKLDYPKLEKALVELGEKAFRAKQVYEWLWKKSATSFEEMTNLSKPLREVLITNFSLNTVSIKERQVSNDKTIKYAFQLPDANTNTVEGVLIPTSDRMTACISSQVGCSLSCKFCATGYMDRKKNLDAYEIYDQVVLVSKEAEENYGIPLSNIVYMGMGEPLLNYANVLQSVEHITSDKGLGMSPKRITVSTAGIAKMIKKLGDDEVKFNLAVSLHAANDTKRNEIMPINESNSLAVLAEALQYFYSKTKTRVTFEYIVFAGFNDTLEDANELWEFSKCVPCKINIIEYNPIDLADYKNADPEAIDKFQQFLERKGAVVNVRRSRGKDIDAACGQLAGKSKN